MVKPSRFLSNFEVKSTVKSEVKSKVESEVKSEVKSEVESEAETKVESKISVRGGGAASRVRTGENFAKKKILRGEAPQDFLRDHGSNSLGTGATVERVR